MRRPVCIEALGTGAQQFGRLAYIADGNLKMPL